MIEDVDPLKFSFNLNIKQAKFNTAQQIIKWTNYCTYAKSNFKENKPGTGFLYK